MLHGLIPVFFSELCHQMVSDNIDEESHSCIVQYIFFPPQSTSSKDRYDLYSVVLTLRYRCDIGPVTEAQPLFLSMRHSSFSTDDDNDTEVEAVEVDTELNLVTECWVEPQSGSVMNCMDQHRHFQGLRYQEIPQAVCITSATAVS